MERKIPVIIWITRRVPNKNPKFHIRLIEEGEGRSDNG